MSNNPAGPTLAEGTIVERKGDDVTDRMAPDVIHFRAGKKEELREAAEEARPLPVKVDVPDGGFVVESKEDQAPPLEQVIGKTVDPDDAGKD
jgi:hypothetical protein